MRRLERQLTAQALEQGRPHEVDAPLTGEAEERLKDYLRFSDLREPYRVDVKYLPRLRDHFLPPEVALTPTIAFVNTRSGGSAGVCVFLSA